LQVEPEAERLAGRSIRHALNHECGLLNAEDVRARVVGAQQVDAIRWPVGVVFVVALERHPERDALPRVGADRGRRLRARACRLEDAGTSDSRGHDHRKYPTDVEARPHATSLAKRA
jgi:hypothetical protein